MTKQATKINAEINPATFKDGRGIIKTFYPESDNIAEWNYIVTNKGNTRGFHYHKEFDEYIMMIQGEGVYVVTGVDGTQESIPVGAGECLYLPANVPHTLYPITDCKMIAMITKRWNDCAEPITRFEP